jgi:sporulation protein YlmC with PRC-barrel domain
MLTVEQISEWLGQEVYDSEGEPLGKLDDVFYSKDATEPQLAVIKSGLLGRKQTVVPLSGASVGRDHLRIAFSADQIAAVSDQNELEAGDTIAGSGAQQLGAAYGVQLAAGDLDSANALEQRRREAAEAEARAQKLEAQARERAEKAEQAQASAQERTEDASEAQRAAHEAREQAERLRP